MTPAARLREHAARLEYEAAALRALADSLDGAEAQSAVALPAPAPARPDGRQIGVSAACKIAGRSVSSMYRDAARFGFGRKLRSGGWTFDEAKLRAFVRGEIGEIGEIGEASLIDAATSMSHLRNEK